MKKEVGIALLTACPYSGNKMSRPIASSPAARARMVKTRARDNPRELGLRSILHRLGLRFYVHRKILAGTQRTADIVFPRRRVVVYLDGCFWHGCPLHGTWPKSNAEWWRNKIETNKRRDADTNARLLEEGWIVLRIWEHEDLQQAADRIAAVVRRN